MPPVVTSTWPLLWARSTKLATRLRWRSEMSGPISTPSSRWLPTLMEATASVMAATNLS
ncbi:hypothetical protein D3C73_1268520 [compost metagenome]